MKKPLRYLKDTILSVFHYVNEYKKYDIVYINTVVMLSALLAAVFLDFQVKKSFAMLEKYLQISKFYFLKLFLNSEI